MPGLAPATVTAVRLTGVNVDCGTPWELEGDQGAVGNESSRRAESKEPISKRRNRDGKLWYASDGNFYK